jgi:hypothetical protein
MNKNANSFPNPMIVYTEVLFGTDLSLEPVWQLSLNQTVENQKFWNFWIMEQVIHRL